MKRHFTFPSCDKKTKIHCIEWVPDGEVTAILQISHGMVEYIERYDRFAKYLMENGIMVVGNDHLGHGESVQTDEDHGYFGDKGNEMVVGDIHRLRRLTQNRYPDVPYFLLGHSMGSFLARQYIELYGAGLSGAIIMGTGYFSKPVLQAGMGLCRNLARVHGWRHRSKLVDAIGFSSNNKKFKPARTDVDWLTKDEAIVDAYLASPWCTFKFTLNGFYHMFRGIYFCSMKQNISRIPKDLPVFFVSGNDDPVGEFGKGVRKVYDSFVSAGISDVRIKLYEGDRHEILNETDHELVDADLLAFIREFSK